MEFVIQLMTKMTDEIVRYILVILISFPSRIQAAPFILLSDNNMMIMGYNIVMKSTVLLLTTLTLFSVLELGIHE